MTAKEIVEELRTLGAESIKKVLRNHGVQEPFFGVKIGDMKKIQKRIKKDYQLALDLYDTGNYDAMYLAGLVADDARMTKKRSQSLGENGQWRRTRISHCPLGRGGKQPRVRDRAGVDRIRQRKRGCCRVGDSEQPGGHEGRRRS